MGSFAALETEAGGKSLILTADRDMFQCANDDVTILLQKARQQGPDEVGPDQVREIYGIDPSQVPDFIALRGDPSDGLPGAKGIGAKTAADLLRRKGDLEHVILGAIRETPVGAQGADRAGRRAAHVPGHRDAAHGAAGAPGGPRDGLRGRRRRRPRSSAWAGWPSGSRAAEPPAADACAASPAASSPTRLGPGEQVVRRVADPVGGTDRDRRCRRTRAGAARRGRRPGGRWRAAARAARRPPSGRSRRRRAGRRRAAAPGPRRCPSGTRSARARSRARSARPRRPAGRAAGARRRDPAGRSGRLTPRHYRLLRADRARVDVSSDRRARSPRAKLDSATGSSTFTETIASAAVGVGVVARRARRRRGAISTASRGPSVRTSSPSLTVISPSTTK